MVKPLVFQSDFGYGDGAVSAMYGVAYSVVATRAALPVIDMYYINYYANIYHKYE